MSEGYNRAVLVGNLGADPELRFTQNNSAVLNLRMATTESYKDKDSGERKENVQWHNVTVWGNRAEPLSKILVKGSRILVEGRIENRTYDDKDGVKKTASSVNASNIVLMDSKKDSEARQGGGQSQGNGRQQNQGGQRQQGQGNGQRSQQGGGSQNGGQRQQSQQRTAAKPRDEAPDDFGGDLGDDLGGGGGSDVPF